MARPRQSWLDFPAKLLPDPHEDFFGPPKVTTHGRAAKLRLFMKVGVLVSHNRVATKVRTYFEMRTDGQRFFV